MNAFNKMIKKFEDTEKLALAAFRNPENREREARNWEKKFSQLIAAYQALDVRENVDGSFSPRLPGEEELQAEMAWNEVMC
jgi:hypothetical protein